MICSARLLVTERYLNRQTIWFPATTVPLSNKVGCPLHTASNHVSTIMSLQISQIRVLFCRTPPDLYAPEKSASINVGH